MTIRSGEAYGTMFGDLQSSDGRPDPRRGIPPLDLSFADPEAIAEGRIRQEGKTNYTFEYPEEGSTQFDTWDLMTKNGFIDPTAVPGSAKNPIFEKAGRGAPPAGAAWVGLDGSYHEPYGAYTTVQPEDLPPESTEAPFTFGGTAKAALSGLAGTVFGTAESINPLDPHGWANNLEAVTAMGGWLGNKFGVVSDDAYANALEAERNFRRRFGSAGETTDEMLHSLHLYHDPQNRWERVAEFIGSQLPYAVAPELSELGAASRLGRMAERSTMRELGREAQYLADRQATRVARAVSPLAGGVAGETAASALGGDETDKAMMRGIGAGVGSLPHELGARPVRFGDKWNVNTMPPEEIYDVSTRKMSPGDIADSITATRQANALSYLTDGFTVRNTKGRLRSEANAWNKSELERAEAAGKPYRYQVGHSPDAALSGKPYSMMDPIDQRPMSNATIGGGLGQRIGDHIKLFTLDGVPHGLPSRFDGAAYYGLMGGQLVNSASQDHDH
ncbi:MAG: hypothetical protein JSR86_01130 [Proteobacteria bacterium]|nr:hypothetical protein [Pseudomonadota bacterium]